MNQQILVTGATGMVGRQLVATLQQMGYGISILSRRKTTLANVKVFLWDIYKQQIDTACMEGIDTIIHLAGEPIADKKWTKERKQQIIDSRVLSTQLLYKAIRERGASVKNFISASAVGYYGNRGDEILTETSAPGQGFMAHCCKAWEDAVDEGDSLQLRIAKFRIGFILARKDGALASLDKPIRFFVGAALGSGQQWIPWVHIDDIVEMFVKAIGDQNYQGAYNACAPYPVTNTTLTKAVAKVLNRPVWPIKVPEVVLEMILGKMSDVVTLSTNTSAQKLLDAGFIFKYTHLENALNDIYRK